MFREALVALLRINPTSFDRNVAGFICDHTTPEIELISRLVTWGADEHLLLVGAGIAWLVTRSSPSAARRKYVSHLLATTFASALLPHVLKTAFDQKRPDRQVVAAHLKGIPISGKPNDAFPSGHAIHMGALASAASLLPRRQRNAVWTLSGLLSATRIAILAHWTTDVVAGFALGIGVERFLRLLTEPVPLQDSGK